MWVVAARRPPELHRDRGERRRHAGVGAARSRTAGLDVRSGEFANSDLVENAHLAFLGDVFAIPAGWPGANVFSVGDA